MDKRLAWSSIVLLTAFAIHSARGCCSCENQQRFVQLNRTADMRMALDTKTGQICYTVSGVSYLYPLCSDLAKGLDPRPPRIDDMEHDDEKQKPGSDMP
jgi:hypothetical protein